MNGESKQFDPKELAVITESLRQATRYFEEKIKGINWLMAGVVIVVFIAFVTMVVDLFRFNSTIYREYSEKIESLDQIQKTNEALLESVETNQGLIMDQQKEIQRLLEKK